MHHNFLMPWGLISEDNFPQYDPSPNQWKPAGYLLGKKAITSKCVERLSLNQWDLAAGPVYVYSMPWMGINHS